MQEEAVISRVRRDTESDRTFMGDVLGFRQWAPIESSERSETIEKENRDKVDRSVAYLTQLISVFWINGFQ